LRTSGEIRFHLERDVPAGPPVAGDPYLQARRVFDDLGMHRTADRNGVLVYMAVRSRKFAVVGDEELHARVGDGFWSDVVEAMGREFGEGRFAKGLETGIALIGEKLCEFFPYQDDDVNELPDEISYGDDVRD
ncbi:TPM domain-containing protein, partial [bacterium]|nr:TPM domain-containing protein [bacterium]